MPELQEKYTLLKKETQLWQIIAEIGSVWIISNIAYYLFRPLLGPAGGYNGRPVEMALYYLFWVAVAGIAFQHFYNGWKAVAHRPSTYASMLFLGTLIAGYLLFILPAFPQIQWDPAVRPPSELLFASPWYFLPKSMEILLQQVLIAALALAFTARGFSLKTTSYWCAACFGSAHLLLVLGGASAAYVLVFTSSAVAAALVFPYLILRVRNGFVYSYFLHWAFYAVAVILTRVLFA